MSASTVLHLLTAVDAPALAAIAADRAAGQEVQCVLLHDAVYLFGGDGAPPCDRLWVCADDRRRRGLEPGESAVEYAGILEVMARATRVVSW